MRTNSSQVWSLLALVAMLFAVPATDGQERNALLIGCSKYPHFASASELPGVANDVAGMREALTRRFGFDEAKVKTLSGWSADPGDAAKLPTRANIVAAFEELIDKAAPGSHAFVYLSGHGMPVPLSDDADLLDPNDPEPDGFDEAFLPSDMTSTKDVILDDQFGDWFDALRSKGVHVWAVFDCCYSGTIARGEGISGSVDAVEKFVAPEVAGISEEEIKRAKERSAANQERTDAVAIAVKPSAPDVGSFVAFYACQPFQTAAERTLPPGAPKDDENRHSVFSYCLIETLRSRTEALSYRQLGAAVSTRVMTVFGGASRSQTPIIQGDIDGRVFGASEWPASSPITLHARDGVLKVSPGTLADVHEGTVLVVVGAAEPRKYLLAKSATATRAEVSPCDKNGDPLAEPVPYEDGSGCRIHRPSMSQRPLQVAVQNLTGNAEADLNPLIAEIKAALKTEPVSFDAPAGDADWTLAYVDAKAAKERFGIVLTQPSVVLAPATVKWNEDGSARNAVARPFEDNPKLARAIATDLHRIRVWNALWKLAVAYPTGANAKEKVTLEVKFPETGDAIAVPTVRNGDRIAASVTNADFRNSYYYSLLFLNDAYGIRQLTDGSLSAKPTTDESSHELGQLTIEERSEGVQALLLVAVSHRDKSPLDLRYLQQPPLGAPASAGEGALDRGSVATLLEHVTGETYRATTSDSPSAPQTSAVIWTVRK